MDYQPVGKHVKQKWRQRQLFLARLAEHWMLHLHRPKLLAISKWIRLLGKKNRAQPPTLLPKIHKNSGETMFFLSRFMNFYYSLILFILKLY